MYDTFQNMIHDLFNNPDLYEFCYIEGFKYKCFCTTVEGGTYYTETGMVDDVNFALDIQMKNLDRLPQQNDRIVFRDKEYKISHIDTDSALATQRLYLISNSKGK